MKLLARSLLMIRLSKGSFIREKSNQRILHNNEEK